MPHSYASKCVGRETKACHTSRPLEKGRAECAGWMCLEEAPFYVAVSMATVQSAAPYRHWKRSRRLFLPHSYASKCAGRETKARYYMPYEQPLGDGSPAEGLPSLASSKEAPSLPTKAPSYEAKRPAPKAQDRCASKRHPSTQRSV